MAFQRPTLVVEVDALEAVVDALEPPTLAYRHPTLVAELVVSIPELGALGRGLPRLHASGSSLAGQQLHEVERRPELDRRLVARLVLGGPGLVLELEPAG